MNDMPLIPGHPEPHITRWSALESEAIRQYGEQCYRAGLAQPAQPAPSDPLQLMADNERELGLSDDLGAIQPAPQPSTAEAVERAMRRAIEVLDEAVGYVERPTWSPSMARDCRRASAALRSAVEALANGELA